MILIGRSGGLSQNTFYDTAIVDARKAIRQRT
jgi:hypothetical protein